MKATPSLSIYILLHLTAVIFLRHSAAAETPASPSPAPSAADTNTEFVRTSCQSTLYPEVCYNTMAPYASRVQQDRGKLAQAAIGESMRRAKRAAAHFNALSRQGEVGAADPLSEAALHDCFSQFGDSVDQMHDSLAQMNRLGGSAEELKFQMSNVQTWMSAAETNEDTCVDGFDGVADGPLKTDVCDRVTKVRQVTSNALALVNCFANTITGP